MTVPVTVIVTVSVMVFMFLLSVTVSVIPSTSVTVSMPSVLHTKSQLGTEVIFSLSASKNQQLTKAVLRV